MAETPPDRGARERMSASGQRFLLAIGIDPDSGADQKKLRETLRWADAEQEAQAKREADRAAGRRERRSRNWVFLYGAGSTIFGIAATGLYHYLAGRF